MYLTLFNAVTSAGYSTRIKTLMIQMEVRIDSPYMV